MPFSWVEVQPEGDVDRMWFCAGADADGSHLIAGAFNSRLWLSTDGGSSFDEVQPAGDVGYPWVSSKFDQDGSAIIVNGEGGRPFSSIDTGASWDEAGNPPGGSNKSWYSASISNTGQVVWVGDGNGRLWQSSDYGATYTERQPAGAANKSWRALDIYKPNGSWVYAGDHGGRLWINKAGGTGAWTEVRPGGVDANKGWHDVAMSNDVAVHVAVQSGVGKVWISTDSGANFTDRTPESDDRNWLSCALTTDGGLIMVASSSKTAGDGRVFYTLDYGVNWTETRPAGDSDCTWGRIGLAGDGSKVILGCDSSDGRLYLGTWSEGAGPPAGIGGGALKSKLLVGRVA